MVQLIPEYTCCFGCTNVKTGAIVVCLIEMLLLFMNMFYQLGSYLTGFSGPIPFISALFGCILAAIIMPLAIYGVRKTQPNWLMPVLLVHIISFCLTIIIILIYIGALTSYDFARKIVRGGGDKELSRNHITWSLVATVFLLIGWAILLVWFGIIIYACWKYLKKRARLPQFVDVYHQQDDQYRPLTLQIDDQAQLNSEPPRNDRNGRPKFINLFKGKKNYEKESEPMMSTTENPLYNSSPRQFGNNEAAFQDPRSPYGDDANDRRTPHEPVPYGGPMLGNTAMGPPSPGSSMGTPMTRKKHQEAQFVPQKYFSTNGSVGTLKRL